MRENCTSGTVRGASGNGRPYRGNFKMGKSMYSATVVKYENNKKS